MSNIEIREDGWWNLTKLVSAHNRAIADFLRLKSTKDFVAALEQDLGYSPVQVSVGGTTPGTWAHPVVGAKCMAWVSPSYEVAVYKAASQTATSAQPPQSAAP